MRRNGDGVLLVQRRDRVIDVNVFHPVVRLRPVESELHDGQEEAPDEDVLLAARDLDAVLGPVALAVGNLTREDHFPLVGVDAKVESRVSVEQAADAVVHLQLAQPGKESGIGVDLQGALAVALQVVVPREQVFGEGVEVERIAFIFIFRVLAKVLELRGQARLAHTVVGVEQDELLVLQYFAQVLGQRGQVVEGYRFSHGLLLLRRGEISPRRRSSRPWLNLYPSTTCPRWPNTCAKYWRTRSSSCSTPTTVWARRACPRSSRTLARTRKMKINAIRSTSTPSPKTCSRGTTTWRATASAP